MRDSTITRRMGDEQKPYDELIGELKEKLAFSMNEARGYCAEMSAAKSTLQELIDEGIVSADEVNSKYRRNSQVQYENLGVDVELYMSGE